MSSATITKKSSRLAEAALVAGKGIVGDRYYNNSGTFSEQLKGMAHRAGLRARVITSGTVQPDSAIHRG